MGTGEPPAADTDRRTDGFRLEGGQREVSGGWMHGFFDETNQTRGAAASNQGAVHGRACFFKRKNSETDMTLVRVNPFANLIPKYLLNCRKNIMVMRDALDRADFETVRSLGHQMSGTGAMYGFQFISDTGFAIEQAAEISNIDASRDWVGKLSRYLDGIDAIYGTTGNPVFEADGPS